MTPDDARRLAREITDGCSHGALMESTDYSAKSYCTACPECIAAALARPVEAPRDLTASQPADMRDRFRESYAVSSRPVEAPAFRPRLDWARARASIAEHREKLLGRIGGYALAGHFSTLLEMALNDLDALARSRPEDSTRAGDEAALRAALEDAVSDIVTLYQIAVDAHGISRHKFTAAWEQTIAEYRALLAPPQRDDGDARPPGDRRG